MMRRTHSVSNNSHHHNHIHNRNNREELSLPLPRPSLRKSKSTFSAYLKSREESGQCDNDDVGDINNLKPGLSLSVNNLELHQAGFANPPTQINNSHTHDVDEKLKRWNISIAGYNEEFKTDSYHQEQNVELKIELNDLKQKLKSKDKELNNLLKEITKLTNQNEDVQKYLQDKESQLREMENKVSEIQKQNNSFSQVSNQLEELRVENMQLKANMVELKEQCREIKQLEELRYENSQLKASLIELQEQCREATDKKDHLSQALDRQEEVLDELHETMAQMSAEYEEAKSIIIEKDCVINDLKFQMSRMVSEQKNSATSATSAHAETVNNASSKLSPKISRVDASHVISDTKMKLKRLKEKRGNQYIPSILDGADAKEGLYQRSVSSESQFSNVPSNEEFEIQIKNLQESLSASRSEVETLQKSLNSNRVLREQFSVKIRDLTTLNDTLRNDIALKDGKIQELSDKLSAIEQEQLSLKLQELTTLNYSLKNDAHLKDAKIQELSDKLIDIEQKFQSLSFSIYGHEFKSAEPSREIRTPNDQLAMSNMSSIMNQHSSALQTILSKLEAIEAISTHKEKHASNGQATSVATSQATPNPKLTVVLSEEAGETEGCRSPPAESTKKKELSSSRSPKPKQRSTKREEIVVEISQEITV